MAACSIVIVGKRQKRAQAALVEAGYILVDVTSTSSNPVYRKFSPFYPHGDVPVPGMAPLTARCVEGVWQGLKVFDKEGVDRGKFGIGNMRNIKRCASERRGSVRGHQLGSDLLGYIEARKRIYVPAYQHVLETKLQDELAALRRLLASGTKLALVDYETNEDVECTRKPLAHAALIKHALLVG